MTFEMLELFSGSAVLSDEFQSHNWKVTSLDNEIKYDFIKFQGITKRVKIEPEIFVDILDWNYKNSGLKPDYIHASPPCQTFSVASFSSHNYHKVGNYIYPDTEKARIAISLVYKTVEIINYFNPKYWTIENPKGLMRNVDVMYINDYYLDEISQCQYGNTAQKLTRINHNLPFEFKPPCLRGASCHTFAPRGSKTEGSTQSKKGDYLRGKFPIELCKEIYNFVEYGIKNGSKDESDKLRIPEKPLWKPYNTKLYGDD
jgi:hypothetical protein